MDAFNTTSMWQVHCSGPSTKREEHTLYRSMFTKTKSVCFKGRGSYAVVERGIYNGTKKLHSTIPAEKRKMFAKEAYLLSQIECKNIVGVLGVCDKAAAIKMEYIEFSYLQFERDAKVNSLERLLYTLNEGDSH